MKVEWAEVGNPQCALRRMEFIQMQFEYEADKIVKFHVPNKPCTYKAKVWYTVEDK